MSIQEIHQQLEKMKEDIDMKAIELSKLEKDMKTEEKRLSTLAIILEDTKDIRKDEFLLFFKKPYVTISHSNNRILIAVPKFIKDFQVGWLWKETDSFFIYQFPQYSAWLGDAPKELLEEINFKKEFNATIEGNVIKFDPANREIIKKKMYGHLNEISENQATIIRGHIFDVIAETIENGCLPFKPHSVSKNDMREPKSTITLRKYQKEAFNKFVETGATGIFHPTGSGKSMISLYIMDILKGKKLLIVPTRTLAEQWSYYIETYIPHAKEEIKIATYQGYRDCSDEYVLVVYDEAQRLPANTFSRLAVINSKYRIGLSASPHREDGRESYIFALTGFPVGLNWQEYMETVGKYYHPIYVHSVHSNSAKIRKLYSLLDTKKKTIIFCDTIELGKKISRELNIPYIYGQTNDRMQEIETNKVVCLSRVGDLGISVKDLQRIIEVDFLFGSRQQELQRTGRLMHSEIAERHDIIMTEKEITQYGKRLWSLQEKGFQVKIVSS